MRFNDSALLREWTVQSLIVVRTHLVLVSGKLVLQKKKKKKVKQAITGSFLSSWVPISYSEEPRFREKNLSNGSFEWSLNEEVRSVGGSLQSHLTESLLHTFFLSTNFVLKLGKVVYYKIGFTVKPKTTLGFDDNFCNLIYKSFSHHWQSRKSKKIAIKNES